VFSAQKSGGIEMEKSPRIIQLTAETFDQHVVESSKPVLVAFVADWNGTCHIMMPILEDLEQTNYKEIKFFLVDVERFPLIAERFEVNDLPGLLVFKNGKLSDQMSGLISKAELIKKLAFAEDYIEQKEYYIESKKAPVSDE
jgi:thioredoxin 1